MKTVIFFSILFYAIALPALGELTPQDLDKIRLIVNEVEKSTKGGLTSQDLDKVRLLVMEEIKKDITATKDELKEHINIRSDSIEKQVTFLSYLVYALIALIVGAIAIPQLIMTWRSRREHSLERRVERLTEEIEALKRQQIVKP